MARSVLAFLRTAGRPRGPASPVRAFVQRRLLQAVPVVVGIALLNFLILQIAPGAVVDVLAGEAAGAASPETMAQLRASFGLDQPLRAQFWHYLGNLATLDLGFSYRHNLPVRDLILDRVPAALVLGVLLGILSTARVHGWVDHAVSVSVAVLVAYAMPTFWLGLVAIVLLSAGLGWFPSGGMTDIAADHAGAAWLADVARHTVLPDCTLATFRHRPLRSLVVPGRSLGQGRQPAALARPRSCGSSGRSPPGPATGCPTISRRDRVPGPPVRAAPCPVAS